MIKLQTIYDDMVEHIKKKSKDEIIKELIAHDIKFEIIKQEEVKQHQGG